MKRITTLFFCISIMLGAVKAQDITVFNLSGRFEFFIGKMLK